MKLPAIRANIGNWIYYITTLTFSQVDEHVEKIDDQLHKSEGLRDLIQRSITVNYVKIKEYIQNQPEMFFNSLVLGVYDGTPKWIEVELNLEDEDFFNLGFLDFPGNEKIFPIDGQHRVEGIKAALKEDSSLGQNKIGAIFIGHSKDKEGMEKSRRLFTTLNRYAKPVTMDDIIALDEDDSIAINTRSLLENFDLFAGKRVTKSKNKAIADRDKDSLTSIITLYQCNSDLLKSFRIERKKNDPNPKRDKKSFIDYLKFRPDEIEISLFEEYLKEFWTPFKNGISEISAFTLVPESTEPAKNFRNRENGGCLLFRPVGLLPFVQAAIEIRKRRAINFEQIFIKLNNLNYNLDEIPWRNILWNLEEKTMIMGTQSIVKLLLLYMYDPDILSSNELNSLNKKYADRTGFKGDSILTVLENIPTLSSK